MLEFAWQWWVSQGFAIIALVFYVISFQQKTRITMLWYHAGAMFFMVCSALFLMYISNIVLVSVSLVRTVLFLCFAYLPSAKKHYTWITGICAATAVIVLNIVFWENWFSIMSMILGIGFTLRLMLSSPRHIRFASVIVGSLAITYCVLMWAPINAVFELVGLISVIIGIVRFDIKRKSKTLNLNQS